MRKKIKIYIVTVVIIAIVLAGCSSAKQKSLKKQTSVEPIKIGVIAPLTGKGAAWGESVKNGIELALEKINQRKGINGRLVRIIYEDDQLDPKKSVSAFKKLTDIDKVLAIIGPAGSNNAESVSPLVLEQKIPTILTAVGLSGITENNKYLFRIWPSESIKAKAMKIGLKKAGYQNIAVISSNQASTLDLLKQLKENVFPALKIKIILDEVVDLEARDFRTPLSKFKTADIDAVFVNLYAGQVGLGIKQARELGITAPIFSNILAESPKELELAGKAMEGVWFPGSPIPENNFLTDYKAKFGIDSERAAPTSYDALMFYAKVIEKVGTDRKKIIDELSRFKNYQGAFGNIYFNSSGDAVLNLPLKTVRKGEFVVME